MANKVQNRIENRKYYSALKLLEELEEKYLKKSSDFAFVKKMSMRFLTLSGGNDDSETLAITKQLKAFQSLRK
jgi:hypothetical protein